MYAIIQNGTHQYKAKAGTFLRVEKREEKPGDKGAFDKILAFSNKEGDLLVGTPYVIGAKVYFQVIRHGKGKKKLVFKKKRRKGYRRTKGHRQEFTELYIETLSNSTGQKINIPLNKEAKQQQKKSALTNKSSQKALNFQNTKTTKEHIEIKKEGV